MTIRRLLAILLLPLALAACEAQRTVLEVREDAAFHYRYGRYAQAAEDYAEVVERDPADWRARTRLGETLLLIERPDAAREQLAIAYGVRPNDDDIVTLYAQALLASDRTDELISLLRAHAEANRTVENFLRLGEFAQEVGDVDEAERAFLTAARLDEGRSVAPQLALADLYASVGDEERALRRLRMALYLDPRSEMIQQRIRAYGEIPGPSFALVPAETP